MSGDTSFPVDLHLQSESDEFDRTLGPAVHEALSRGSSTEELPEDATSDCPHLTRFVESDNAWTVEEEQHIAACPHCQRRLRVAARLEVDDTSSHPRLAREVVFIRETFWLPAVVSASSYDVEIPTGELRTGELSWKVQIHGHDVLVEKQDFSTGCRVRLQTQAAELEDVVIRVVFTADEHSTKGIERPIELRGTSDGWYLGTAEALIEELHQVAGSGQFQIRIVAE